MIDRLEFFKRFLCFTIMVFLLNSCSDESSDTLKMKHLENENLYLKSQLKEIKLKFNNEVINPIIIENNYGEVITDKVSFAAFLAYDRPELIDSIEFNLYKLDTTSMELSRERTIKKKHIFKQDYIDVIGVEFENLNAGQYYVKGCFYVRDKIGDVRILEFRRKFTVNG